ncbi:MAG: 2-amino-4-hydroxy-6-hydroxymethyldihydropteridine diphosphokinase [Cellvibrionaceae bacterium]
MANVTGVAMERVYISAGSNSNRQQNIAMALARLRQQFGKLSISPVYESEAIDGTGDNYYNLVVGLDTDLSVSEIHHYLRRVEEALGRERGKSGAITIDLDLLLYGRVSGNIDGIQLPHPDLERYRHVLQPFVDIAGDMTLPGSERSVKSLLDDPQMADTIECVGTGNHEIS